jgi:prepilin peptidase CpaA
MSFVYIAAVALFTSVAAVSDWRTRRLPNWLTVSAFVAALVTHTVSGGLSGLGFSLLGFATGFGILLVLWLIGGGGGGDVKLMGALGAWLGVRFTLYVFVASAALAAIVTAARLLVGMLSQGAWFARRFLAAGSAGRPGGRGHRRDHAGSAHSGRKRLLPFAVPVAMATWLVLAFAWKNAVLPW